MKVYARNRQAIVRQSLNIQIPKQDLSIMVTGTIVLQLGGL